MPQQKRQRKSKSKPTGKSALLGWLLVIVLLALVGAWRYGVQLAGHPEEEIAALIGAIRRKSVSGVASVVEAPGLTLSEGSLTPLFRMADEASGQALEELEARLSEQVRTGEPTEHEAIAMEVAEQFLWFCRWQIVFRPVSLTLTTDAPDCILWLDGEPLSEHPETSIQLDGLMPGLHHARVYYTQNGMVRMSPIQPVACLMEEMTWEILFPDCADEDSLCL